MRGLVTVMLALILTALGCSAKNDTGGKQAAMPAKPESSGAKRGGTITVGEDSWTIVPARQCSVYPGNVVSISGHAAEDPDLEIVIDYGGPNQVRIGGDVDGPWHAMKDTIKMEIDGRRVRGTATFNDSFTGTGQAAEGSFEVNCG